MTAAEENPRGFLARIGICALNLIAPGLGLFRSMRPRLGLFFILAPVAFCLALLAIFAILERVAPAGFLAIAAAGAAVVAISWIGSIVLSWRSSQNLSDNWPWWSRWYGLAAIWAASMAFTWIAVPDLHRFYKPFYIPAESMMPALRVGDRLVADMRGKYALKRGDIVILRVGPTDYVKRVVGLPGDRIELRTGVIWMNGREVAQHKHSKLSLKNELGYREDAAVLEEQLPGERASHRILDLGPSPGDDFGPVTVPPGGLFVLGDN